MEYHILAILGLVLVYYICVIVYHLTLHPLAKYPGPKLAAASKWYEFYFDFVKAPTGQFMYEVWRMHEKYGPVVRINPEELHIQDADFYETLYAPGSRRDKYTPAAKMTGIPKATFGTVDHELHRIRRAPNMMMFTKRAIHGPIAEILCDEAEALSEQFKEMHKTGEPRNVIAMFLGYTSVFSCRFFMGKRVDHQENQESLTNWYDTVVRIPKDTVVIKQFPWMTEFGMALPRSLQMSLYPPLVGVLDLHRFAQSRARDFLDNSVADDAHSSKVKTSKIDTPATLFHAITQSNLPGEEKSYDRLWQEAFNVFFASVDTTSRTLAYATYYLLKNPDFYIKLCAELDAVFPNPAILPDDKVLGKLPLMTAAIKETIRCMQLISGRTPVVCYDEIVYDRFLIPAGTPISMTINDIMQSPSIYPNPRKWDPYRWLDVDGRIHSHLDKYWIPFGKGPRQCQGIDMAWAIIFRGLSTVHRRFELALYGMNDDRDTEIVSERFFGDPSPQSRGIRIVVRRLRH